jgi:hypothetical protein
VPEPTVIYVDGDRLTLVHYCEAGNRPRLVALQSPQGMVKFAFADISGSTAPAYLHDLVFTPTAPDHHSEDWTFTLPGGKSLRAHFDLQRAKASASPPAGK